MNVISRSATWPAYQMYIFIGVDSGGVAWSVGSLCCPVQVCLIIHSLIVELSNMAKPHVLVSLYQLAIAPDNLVTAEDSLIYDPL